MGAVEMRAKGLAEMQLGKFQVIGLRYKQYKLLLLQILALPTSSHLFPGSLGYRSPFISSSSILLEWGRLQLHGHWYNARRSSVVSIALVSLQFWHVTQS